MVVGGVGVQHVDCVGAQPFEAAGEDPVDVVVIEAPVAAVDPRRSDLGRDPDASGHRGRA